MKCYVPSSAKRKIKGEQSSVCTWESKVQVSSTRFIKGFIFWWKWLYTFILIWIKNLKFMTIKRKNDVDNYRFFIFSWIYTLIFFKLFIFCKGILLNTQINMSFYKWFVIQFFCLIFSNVCCDTRRTME